jgi:hypothetical protein
MSWRRVILLIYGVLCPYFRRAATEGRALAWTVAMSDAVLLRVGPAWPMGMHTSSISSYYGDKGVVLLDIFVELLVAAEVLAKVDLDEDKGAD